MSAFNKDMISDESLRHLLQLCVLEGDDDDILTRQLIEMETNFALGSEIFNLPAIPGEDLMLKKLKTGLGKTANLKWLFTGIIVATGAAGIALYNGQSKNRIQSTTLSSPIPVENTIEQLPPVTEQVTPEIQRQGMVYFDMDTAEPSNSKPGSFIGFKMPEMNFEPFQFVPPPILMPDSPIIGSRHVFLKREIPVEIGSYSYDTIMDGIKKIVVDGGFCNILVGTTEEKHTTFSSSIDIDGKFKKRKGSYLFNCERIGSTLKVSFKPQNININATNLKLDGLLRFDVPDDVSVELSNSSGSITVTGLKSNNNMLNCRYGNIRVSNISGSLSMTDGSGNIDAENIEGKLKANARYGSIVLDNINASSDISSGSGNLNITHHTGDLKVEARYGNVRLENMRGNLEIVSSSGSVTCNDIKGKTCSIQSNYGNIHLSNIESELNIVSRSGYVIVDSLIGNARIESVYGKQTISDMNGDLNTSSRSGDIYINRQTGSLILESNYGDVSLYDCKGKMNLNIRSGNLNAKSIELVESLDIISHYGDIKFQLDNDVKALSFYLDTPKGKSSVVKDDVNISKEKTSLVIKNGDIQIRSQATSGSQYFN